jgi:Tfp pilus assembly protein PilV
VALVLVALAAGGVAAVATASGRTLVAASHDASGTTLALDRAERWRAGPRTPGADVVAGADGTTYARRWTITDGRGRADGVEATVGWSSSATTLATAALP